MITRALAKYIRVAPKKMHPIAGLIYKKKAEDALYLLMNLKKKGAKILTGVIQSALSNARNLQGKNFAEEDLYISKVTIDSGPTLKRFRAMSMGRAGTIRKRTSHILIELDVAKQTPRRIHRSPRRGEGETGSGPARHAWTGSRHAEQAAGKKPVKTRKKR